MKHHVFNFYPSYLFNTFRFFQYSINITTMIFRRKIPLTTANYFFYSKASFKLYDLTQLYPRAESLTSLEIILPNIY